MRTIGFSTGALALGDFRRALSLLDCHDTSAIELSALRDTELPELLSALPELELGRYERVSIHAPSKFKALTEKRVAEMLLAATAPGIDVVLHPDAIVDFGCWREFGDRLCVENNDKRKPGRTVRELEPVFEKLPDASWCFDIAHARQVDGSLLEAWRMLRTFGGRLRQIHLSELDSACRHCPISFATVSATQELFHLTADASVVIESAVSPAQIADELSIARRCFTPADKAESGVRRLGPLESTSVARKAARRIG